MLHLLSDKIKMGKISKQNKRSITIKKKILYPNQHFSCEQNFILIPFKSDDFPPSIS